MLANPARAGHNVGVRPPAPRGRRARRALIASLLAPVLLLSGCGGESGKKPAAKPSTKPTQSDVKVPDGITPTKAGTKLDYGQSAVVAYEPNAQRKSVLALNVRSVQQGSISDLAAYQLSSITKRSQLYYVRAVIKNVGTGDLSRSAVPLYAVTDRDTLVQPSTFNNTFTRCPSLPLPAGFVEGRSTAGCLVYLLPPGTTLSAVSFRPLQAFEPITWTGAIAAPTLKKAARKPGGRTHKSGSAKQGTP